MQSKYETKSSIGFVRKLLNQSTNLIQAIKNQKQTQRTEIERINTRNKTQYLCGSTNWSTSTGGAAQFPLAQSHNNLQA